MSGHPLPIRYRSSAGVELPGARPGYIVKCLRSNDMPRPAHALSVYPPWRAQMSAARRACGRAELAL
eukprot:scaffold25807_cov60-Phaeocystis_antarctica.AAC.1